MDSQKMPLLGKTDLSIEAVPEKSLEKALSLMTKEQLEEILNFYMADSPVFRNNAELSKFLEELIQTNCCRYFFYVNEGVYKNFETFYDKRSDATGISEVELYKTERPDDGKIDFDDEYMDFLTKSHLVSYHLINAGLLFHYIGKNNEEYFVIPDEVYAEITKCRQNGSDKNFGKWEDLRYFAQILISVYGVVTADDFMTLWNIFRPENKLTYDETLKHIKFSAMYNDEGLYYWHEALSAVSDLSLDEEGASDILEGRKRYDFFIPDKKLLEKWLDDFENSENVYIINDCDQFEVEYDNPFYIRMLDFLLRVRKKQDDAFNVLYELMTDIKLGYFPSQTLEMLNQEFDLINKMSKKDFGVFMATYQMLHNSTHLWTNYGWSPDELSRHFSSMSAVMQNPIQNPGPFTLPDSYDSETQTFPKVGRNDPCPCGSGKKYKNCHGK